MVLEAVACYIEANNLESLNLEGMFSIEGKTLATGSFQGLGAKPVETPSVKLSAADEEAVSALMGLGFTRTESAQAVKKARELGANSVEEVIMKALQGGV